MSQEFQVNQQELRTDEILAKVASEYSPENREAYLTLFGMHTYKRPHQSRTERRFINRYIIPLGVAVDSYGNFFKTIGENPDILWSCHTDTVHTHKGMQRIGFDKNEIGVAEKDTSNCLGADDGAGLWLMYQLILAKKPGLYIFHRAEEIGRKGSQHVAKNNPSLIKATKFAIALDRREKGSIITHQSSARCCSEAFAKSLATELKLSGMDYKSDDTGSYTDTASYVDLVGECTNLSVGYRNPHMCTERLDVDYIFRLRDALLKLDPAKLDSIRKPGDKEYKSYTYYGNGGGYNAQFKPTLWTDTDGSEYFYRNGRRYNVIPDPKDDDDFFGGEIGYTPNSSTTHNATGRSVVAISGKKVGTEASAATKFAMGDNDSLETAMREQEEASKDLPEWVRKRENQIQKNLAKVEDTDPDEDTPMEENEFRAMTQLVKDHPDVVADILEQFGLDLNGLQDEIAAAFGVSAM